MTQLLSCFNPRRDKPYIIDTSLMAKVNDLGNLAEIEVLIALHEHDLLLPGRENLLQLRLKVTLIEVGLVDLVRRFACTIRQHLTTIVRSLGWSSWWSLGG